jgi:hypothetical protein
MILVFAVTHLVMILCATGILYTSINNLIFSEEINFKKPILNICIKLRWKCLKVINSDLFRIATSYFIALTQLNK